MHHLIWCSKDTGEWVGEAIEEEGGGEVCLTTCSGPGPEERAREYVARKEDTRPTFPPHEAEGFEGLGLSFRGAPTGFTRMSSPWRQAHRLLFRH